MHRRTLLAAAATLTVAPDSPITSTTPPPLPVEENNEWWWSFVKRAIRLDEKWCTDRYLNTAVMRSNLNHISDDEAKQVIRAAYQGAYSRKDIPAPYQD